MKPKYYSISMSRLVRTPLLIEVSSYLKDALSDLSPITNLDNPKKILDLWENTRPLAFDWMAKVVPNISQMSYVYYIHGITDGLNLLSNLETFSTIDGEYPWLNLISDNTISFKNINLIPPENTFYLSQPFAGDGNFNHDIKVSHFNKLAIDAAYIGTTSESHTLTLPKNTQYLLFSLSKPFGLASVRAGLLFSKERINALEQIHNAGYFPYYNLMVMNSILRRFDPFFIHNRLKGLQREVCDHLKLQASDSVFLGTSEDERYNHWRRLDQIARLSLSSYFQQLEPGLFSTNTL